MRVSSGERADPESLGFLALSLLDICSSRNPATMLALLKATLTGCWMGASLAPRLLAQPKAGQLGLRHRSVSDAAGEPSITLASLSSPTPSPLGLSHYGGCWATGHAGKRHAKLGVVRIMADLSPMTAPLGPGSPQLSEAR